MQVMSAEEFRRRNCTSVIKHYGTVFIISKYKVRPFHPMTILTYQEVPSAPPLSFCTTESEVPKYFHRRIRHFIEDPAKRPLPIDWSTDLLIY
jgi:hypothetical protein